jgi:hypothetical protein
VIEDRAFYGCVALGSFVVPGSVTAIGAYVFKGCSSLTAILMDPMNVKSFGKSSFALGSRSEPVVCAVYSDSTDFLEKYSNNYTVFVYHEPVGFALALANAGGSELAAGGFTTVVV